MVSPLGVARNRVYLPWTPLPEGRLVDLPGRGTTFVTDTPGPSPDAPAIVLLHALGTTGLLAWFPCIRPLSKRFRVITLDQRWHGQGIRSEEFSLADCADDVAALADVLGLEEVVVAGYSMGSIVAQRVWRQHPDRVAGLVLGATTDRFQLNPIERAFFGSMGTSMVALRSVAHSRTNAHALDLDRRAGQGHRDMHDWALREFRSTSPWAVGQALAALGRHHSRPWLRRIDVPTAVVVMMRDKVIPTSRQIALARSIPGATIHEVDAGHSGSVLASERFVPRMVEAATTVNARSRDFRRPRPAR
ncbi:alpha/beta fold hydrolase [Nocardioides sp. zg-536]|uniref:Alpha/beta fold hydrolase n=1 Tax=Nocardioides faecalis TaxID=2803858 RepID=A0A938YB62_9ACTN|nr:alpha/beta fold hydrolase [Nocardioides faecalis]MBM9460624.1 alpha/beta fold hydrolase [Nocardioides faecalis]MBS4754313.1 alpha/beta fold hydrolase [Nocardioides faecalis]QVI57457.1 alpha/beta fold hydrolase [Nocardioides faecalis]